MDTTRTTIIVVCIWILWIITRPIFIFGAILYYAAKLLKIIAHICMWQWWSAYAEVEYLHIEKDVRDIIS